MERLKVVSLFRDFYVDGAIMHVLINLIIWLIIGTTVYSMTRIKFFISNAFLYL